jgi:hypothetical protein
VPFAFFTLADAVNSPDKTHASRPGRRPRALFTWENHGATSRGEAAHASTSCVHTENCRQPSHLVPTVLVPYRVLKRWGVNFHQKLFMKHLLTHTNTLAPNKALVNYIALLVHKPNHCVILVLMFRDLSISWCELSRASGHRVIFLRSSYVLVIRPLT